MTHIRNIFDASYAELHGLNADPNTVIKVQELVKEMLETNEHRQRAIYQMLVEEHKALALPGVISATYLFTDHLRNSRTRHMRSALIGDLCAGNLAAQHLLLHSGIVNNPFEESRAVTFAAFQALPHITLTAEEVAWLLKKAHHFAVVEDREIALMLYDILLKQGYGYKDALDTCRNWFAGEYETGAPSALMSALLRDFPQHTETTLTRLFEVIESKDKEAGDNIKKEVRLPNLDAVAPAIAASADCLKRQELRNSRNPRLKAVELFFEGAIAEQLARNPDQLAALSDLVEQYDLDTLSRYWWQALSSAIKATASSDHHHNVRGYIEQVLPRANDDFAYWGYVQLMFLANPRYDKKGEGIKEWATQLLADLERGNPSVYQEAAETYERIIGGEPLSRPVKPEGGSAGLGSAKK